MYIYMYIYTYKVCSLSGVLMDDNLKTTRLLTAFTRYNYTYINWV